MLSDDQRATLAWMVHHKRRWPLVAMCWLGLGYAIVATIVGRNWRRAEAAYVESSASVRALAPAPLPDERNAARRWQAAEAALVPFRPAAEVVASDETDPRPANARPSASRTDPLFTKAWRAESTWAPGSELRRRLADNRQAITEALAAAELADVRWEMPYERALPEYRHMDGLRTAVRLLRAHALEASHDGDWEAFHGTLRALLAAIAHGQQPAGIMPMLQGRSFRSILLDTVVEGVAIARWQVSHERLRALVELVRASGTGDQRLSAVLAADRAHGQMVIDGLGCGRPSGEGRPRDLAAPEALSWYSLIYGLDREFYARMTHAVIVREQARERGDPAVPLDVERDFRIRRMVAPILYVGTGLLLPPLEMINHDLRLQARQELVEMALAACAHRLDSGAWPPASAAGRDPLARDGAAFRWRIDEHGDLEVRSVGRNGVVNADVVANGPSSDDLVYVVHCGGSP